MLTQEDIQKITEATQVNFDGRFDNVDKQLDILSREMFATKDDLESFRKEVEENFNNLQSSIDAYAKKADAYFQEMVMLSHKVDRHEKWLLAMAEKLGMKLEY